MTTQELHIEIDLLFQKVNSHYNQNIQASEKDMFLNREQIKFVNKLINPLNSLKKQAAFDVIKKSVELAPLLKTVDAPLLVDTNKKEARVLLPFDCLYPVASTLTACPTCTVKKLVTHSIYELSFTPIYDRTMFPLAIMQNNDIVSIQPGDIPDEYLINPTTPYYTNKYLFTNALLILLKRANSNIEYKYDASINKIVARSDSHFSIGTNTAAPVSYYKYEDFESSLQANVRYQDEEFLFRANNSSLSGSKDKSVLAYLREKEINFYLPKGVIYGTCRTTYISKPNKIDILLGSNSNLTDASLLEVVGNLVQTLHGVIGTDNYEKYVRENTLIE